LQIVLAIHLRQQNKFCLKIKQTHIFSLLLVLVSLNTFGLSGRLFDFNLTQQHNPSSLATIDDDRSKGVLPENTPSVPSENTEKEERENTENKDESFKCVFGESHSASQNHFEIVNKYATQLNFRHAYYSPLYVLLHSWKAFLLNY
jgi:hypothetical protein